MNIDVHCHIEVPEAASLVPPEGRGTPSPLSPESAAYQKAHNEAIREQVRDPRRKIADLDAMGLHMAVLSISPAQFFYNLDVKKGLEVWRLQNERIAAIAGQHADRFVGVASVPLQDPQAAAAELERAVRELGLRGVEIGSNVLGRYLGDEFFFPFFAKARELDVPIFIHPFNVAGAEKMIDYYFPNLIGNPLDTTITAAHLILGGIFERLRGIKIVLAHAGGQLPYIIGRIAHGWKVRPECRKALSRSPLEFLGEFYYDTIAHGREALEFLVSRVGAARVMLGTDHPYDMGDADPLATLRGLRGLSEEEKEMIAGGNAAALLRI